jgi:hypothetical protein
LSFWKKKTFSSQFIDTINWFFLFDNYIYSHWYVN